MTANWRQKRRVRARMAKTGESYSAALRHLRQIMETKELKMPDLVVRRGGATDVGNVRPTNQDFLLLGEGVFAVADGMGGAAAGEVASRIAAETLEAAFTADPTVEGLVEAARAANRAVWDHAETNPECRGMGTTLTAAALVRERRRMVLAIVNVGDSRAYLYDGERLVQLTSDHSVVAALVSSGALDPEDARTHPRRNVLTQAVGVVPEIEPDLVRALPERGDRVLLCSDGLVNELGNDEIGEILGDTPDPTDAANRLVQAAKDHGGIDNITTVVLDIA